MGSVAAEPALAAAPEMRGESDLPLRHELTTLEELRALSDPLRVSLYRLLRERERTVKELCDLLGESSTRLYYHVRVLENVGLVRLVRTETRAGILHKYFRAVARYVNIPFWLLHEELDSPAARAAAEWYASLAEHAAGDLRALSGQRLPDAERETIFFTRNFVRLGPERAREFSRRLEEFQADLLAADDEAGALRFAFTAAFVPVVWNESDPERRPTAGNDRERRHSVVQDDVEASDAAGR